MSYVRWSSDDFQSDVYCYEDVNGGFTTHIASNRVVFKSPLPPPLPWPPEGDAAWAAWWKRHEKVGRMVEKANRVPIGLPHDGETFNDPTEEAMYARLRELAAMGYHVPEDVFPVEHTTEHPSEAWRATESVTEGEFDD